MCKLFLIRSDDETFCAEKNSHIFETVFSRFFGHCTYTDICIAKYYLMQKREQLCFQILKVFGKKTFFSGQMYSIILLCHLAHTEYSNDNISWKQLRAFLWLCEVWERKCMFKCKVVCVCVCVGVCVWEREREARDRGLQETCKCQRVNKYGHKRRMLVRVS